MKSKYRTKHEKQLQGIFNDNSPLPEYRYKTIEIKATKKQVKIKTKK